MKEPSCTTAAVSDCVYLCINLSCDTHMLSVHLLSYTTLYYLVITTVICVSITCLIKHVYSALACCIVIDFDRHAAICCVLYYLHAMKHMGNTT